MSMEVGRIDLGLDINQKSFNQQLQGIAGGAERSVKSAFAGLGKMIGIALGAAAVGSFVKSSLKLGSALTEVQNVVDTTFTSMNQDVNNFAVNAMEQFGLSETVAKRYTGVLGTMSKSMGTTERTAYEMATSITGLAGDVASFYDMSSDEAFTKLKSIWTGETETLKDLGVIMTQTALDQYALNNGFGKTTKEMSEQEKLMLRYQYVMSRLSGAQGDFAKTSDSWANQVRVLSLRFDSLKATLGQGFINLFTPLVQGLNNLIGKLQGAANAFKSFTELVTGKKIETSTGAVAGNAIEATENILGMGDAAEQSAKKAVKSLMGFDQINQLSDNSKAASKSGTAEIPSSTASTGQSVISDSESSLLSAFEGFKEKIKPTMEALGELKEALKPIGEFVFGNIKSFYEDILLPIGGWVLGEGIPGLVGAVTDLIKDIDWTKLSEAIKTFNKAIAPLAIAVGTGFVNFVKDLSKFLKPALATTVDILAGALDTLADTLGDVDPKRMEDVGYALGVFGVGLASIKIIDKLPAFLLNLGTGLESLATGFSYLAYMNPVMLPALFDLLGLDDWFDELYYKLPDWARGLWEGFWQIILDVLKSTFNYDYFTGVVKDMIASFQDAFDNDGDAWWKIGHDIIKGIVLGLYAAFTLITEPIADFLDSLIKNICNVFGIHSPAEEMKPYGKYILQGLIEGFTGSFSEWWQKIVYWGTGTKKEFGVWAGGIWSGIKDKFTGAPTWFKTQFDNAWLNIKSSFSNVKSWFRGKYNDITGIFNNIPKWFKDKFTEAWTNVKNVFSTGGKIFDGIKDGIADTFKSVVNKLIDGINRTIRIPFDKINNMISILKDVPLIGGALKGFSLSVPQIPMLADGGYVKANTPQLAMIGDNRREGEIVAPESKLRQMAFEAVQQARGTGGLTASEMRQIMIEVFQRYMHFYIGEEDLARHVNRGNEMIDLRGNPVRRAFT